MESKGNTASPYLPMPEIQQAWTGQARLSCHLQLRVEDWLVLGHGRDLEAAGWDHCRAQNSSAGLHHCRARTHPQGTASSGSIPSDTVAAPHGARGEHL